MAPKKRTSKSGSTPTSAIGKSEGQRPSKDVHPASAPTLGSPLTAETGTSSVPDSQPVPQSLAERAEPVGSKAAERPSSSEEQFVREVAVVMPGLAPRLKEPQTRKLFDTVEEPGKGSTKDSADEALIRSPSGTEKPVLPSHSSGESATKHTPYGETLRRKSSTHETDVSSLPDLGVQRESSRQILRRQFSEDRRRSAGSQLKQEPVAESHNRRSSREELRDGTRELDPRGHIKPSESAKHFQGLTFIPAPQNVDSPPASKPAESVKVAPGAKKFAYEELKTLRAEDGIDMTQKEEYLSPEDFAKVMGRSVEEFKAMPRWRQVQAKKDKGLF